ncbi:MAG: YajG family lipoprotein [Endozoicomonas sp.]
MNKYMSVLLAVLVSALVGGCALSPQVIDANPRITLQQTSGEFAGVVAVTVYDERISSTLGSRGGVYAATNPITTSGSLPLTMRSAVELALRELGMQVTDSEKTAQMQVYLDQLDYQVPEGSYITRVDLMSKIRVHVVSEGRRFEGAYSSEIGERVASAPSDAKNQELVEQVLNDVLGRAFGDPQLLGFLTSIAD